MTRVFLPQSHHQGGSLPHLKPGAAIHLQLDQCEGIHPLQGKFAYLTSTLARNPIFKAVVESRGSNRFQSVFNE